MAASTAGAKAEEKEETKGYQTAKASVCSKVLELVAALERPLDWLSVRLLALERVVLTEVHLAASMAFLSEPK